jgi:alkaline phosphatase
VGKLLAPRRAAAVRTRLQTTSGETHFCRQPGTSDFIGWSTELGGTAPWLIRPELVGQEGAATDLEYPTGTYPDSAATATTLYTGSKTFGGAVGVNIYEQPVESVLELAQQMGKSSAVLSSVPLDHATNASAIAHHNYQ